MTTPPPYGSTVRGNDWRSLPDTAPAVGVSVVVLHFEQHEQLARTLNALGRQTHDAGPLEVVVVDDGSATAPTVPPGIRLVQREDVGFTAAAARNQGAAATTQPLLVFLDADTTPEPGFVAELTRLPAVLPEAVVVGRRRHADLAGTSVTAPVEELGPQHRLPEPTWLADGYRASDDLLHADGDSYRYVISAVLACSRWLFEELGGFDEGFVGYGGEDWEWAGRAWQHGAVLAHSPAAVAWHDGPDWSARGQDGVKDLETLRLARRMVAPTASLKGLALGPAELVVTLDPALTDAELVMTVDSLLAAAPLGVVVVSPTQHLLLGDDPRVRLSEPDPPALRLHLAVGVVARPDAWRAVLALTRRPDQPHTVVLRDALGELGRLEVVRAHRRMARWRRDDLFPELVLEELPGLRRLTDDDTLEAYVGGWLPERRTPQKVTSAAGTTSVVTPG